MSASDKPAQSSKAERARAALLNMEMTKLADNRCPSTLSGHLRSRLRHICATLSTVADMRLIASASSVSDHRCGISWALAMANILSVLRPRMMFSPGLE